MATLGVPFSTMRADIDEKAVRHADPYALPVVVAAAKCKALLQRVRIPAVIITADQVVLGPVATSAAARGGHPAANPAELAAAVGLPAGDPVVGFPEALAPGDGASDGDGSAEATGTGGAADGTPAGNGRARCVVEVREKPESEAEAADFVRRYGGGWVQCVSGLVAHNTRTGQRAAAIDVATVEFDAIPEEAQVAMLRPASGEPSPLLRSAGAVVVEHPAVAPFVRTMHAPIDSVMGLPKALVRDLLAAVGGPVLPSEPQPAALAHGSAAAAE